MKSYYRLFLALLVTAFLWTAFFPEYTFTPEVVRILDENGRDITAITIEEMEKDTDLYYDMLKADQDQIVMKSKILEWIGD